MNKDKRLGASASGPGSSEPSPDGLGPSGFDPSRVTLFQCGTSCDHDFFGPESFDRPFEDGNGSERVCGKCGTGAMAFTLSMDF